jgi:hypothetical protein
MNRTEAEHFASRAEQCRSAVATADPATEFAHSELAARYEHGRSRPPPRPVPWEAPVNSERRWTQTCITDLRARVLNGETREDLAAHLGRTFQDVTKIMGRLRLQEQSAAG